MKRFGMPFAIGILGLLWAAQAAEPDNAALIASPEPGWPQWRGPRRDGVSDETGLLQSWPEGGPRLLWTATGLGTGWSSPIITGGSIYLTGDVGQELHVVALDRDGKITWRTQNGAAWKRSYPGARACCAYSAGQLYHMNAHGRIACFNAATGKEVWTANIMERFDGDVPTWAVSECLLVDGANVIVTPGGRKSYMAALDKRTGETVWASAPLPTAAEETTGYSSPILFKLGGRRLLVTLSVQHVVCVDADKGSILWTFHKKTRHDANCATPIFVNGHVFHTNPTGSGGVLLKTVLAGDAARVEKLWECRVDNISGGALARDGFIYSSGHMSCGWVCMDARTGEEKWESRELAQGSLAYADGRLYVLSEKGVMALLKAGPEFAVAGRFSLTDGRKSDAWAHPVILDSRLYLRYHENLYCYDIRRPAQ